MSLMHAPLEKELIIKEINTGDEELDSFLFSLGCYIGEPITIISRRINGCVVAVKDSRYHIDKKLANAIIV